MCSDINSQLVTDVIDEDDVVINCAAESHVDKSFENPLLFSSENIMANHTFIENIMKRKFSNVKIIHFSTDEVYGTNLSEYKKEDAAFVPTNPYSATKAGMDLLVQSYIKSFGLSIKIVRPNNIFGERQFFEKLIPKLFHSAQTGAVFPIHGTGENRRHFLHTTDLYSAIKTILNNWEHPHSAYNLASKDEYSVNEIVDKVKIIFPDLAISRVTDRPFNDARYMIDDSRIRSLGWEPTVDFDESFAQISNEAPFYL
jgi:dTDP-glucose 4,6-dehydratase